MPNDDQTTGTLDKAPETYEPDETEDADSSVCALLNIANELAALRRQGEARNRLMAESNALVQAVHSQNAQANAETVVWQHMVEDATKEWQDSETKARVELTDMVLAAVKRLDAEKADAR